MSKNNSGPPRAAAAPPPRRRSRDKSVVETIIDRLSDKDQVLLRNHCHNSSSNSNGSNSNDVKLQLIRSLDESLRTLGTKVRVGALGKGDSSDCRAAILLYQRVPSILSIQKLAKTCSIHQKDLQNLSNKVANYTDAMRSSTRRSAATISGGSVTTAATSQGRPRSSAYSTVGASHQQPQPNDDSIISTLAIKLGSWIPDSHGFAQRTVKLLDDIQHHIQNFAKKHDKQGYLNDIRRKRTEYEAVCFYMLLQENQLLSSGASSTTTVVVDDDDTTLTTTTTTAATVLAKLLDAAGQVGRENEFWSVYGVAKGFWDEIKAIQRHKEDGTNKPKSTAGGDSRTKRAAAAASKEKASNKKKKKTTAAAPSSHHQQQSLKTAAELLGLVTTVNSTTKSSSNLQDSNAEHSRNDKAATQYSSHDDEADKKSALFLQWKARTLQNVLERTVKEHSNDDDDVLSDSQALANAATVILNKILSSSDDQ